MTRKNLTTEQFDNAVSTRHPQKPDWAKRNDYNDRQRERTIARKQERQDKRNRQQGQ